MRVELFGLGMDAPGVTFSLWSPWRCTAIEHKLFDALKGIADSEIEIEPDEVRIHLTTEKQWKAATDRLTRVLKGWQEEAAEAGSAAVVAVEDAVEGEAGAAKEIYESPQRPAGPSSVQRVIFGLNHYRHNMCYRALGRHVNATPHLG